MKTLSAEEIGNFISEFAQKDSSVLFTGAGLGKAVGYPLWDEYIQSLANKCDEYNAPDEANLIRAWLKKGKLIQAAGIFEETTDIPEGKRMDFLVEPFKKRRTSEQLDNIASVFQLPFEAVVTTNYDLSQHDAYTKVKGHMPRCLELEGSTMINGARSTDYYIARIHGNADAPNSIILTPKGYDYIGKNEVYQDFLLNLFQTRPCLFVGFSFLDPAIDSVLSTYQRKAHRIFEVEHAALIPKGKDSVELAERLSALNARTVFYEPEDRHKALWNGFNEAVKNIAQMPSVIEKQHKEEGLTENAFHRFLSFTYAQIRVSKDTGPLLEQAREGIIYSIIEESGEVGCKLNHLEKGLKDALLLDDNEASRLAEEGIVRLFKEKQIKVRDDLYRVAQNRSNSEFEHSLEKLTLGVINRQKVQFDKNPMESDSEMIRDALEQLFMVRAWDLGAHYAGGGGGYRNNISEVVSSMYVSSKNDIPEDRLKSLSLSTIALLQSPTDDEAEYLAEISRAAFSLQLVLSSPRQSLFKAHALPQRIYFDASVLLPAITPGHPFYKLYNDSIKRMVASARESGVTCQLCVGQPFLNEIHSHRELALELAASLRVDDAKELLKASMAYGLENLNVYIGGFAGITLCPEKPNRISFDRYIRENAPYTNEVQLAGHLEKLGFEIVPMDFRDKHNATFNSVFSTLVSGYENEKEDFVRGKEKILIKHEASQLVQVSIESSNSLRTVFVSNDRKLRRICEQDATTRKLVSNVISSEGFIGLVDILIGYKPDHRGLARLLWASCRKSSGQMLRDYLVNRALLEYDDAKAKVSAEIIDDIMEEAEPDIRERRMDLSDNRSPESATETMRYFDRFENRFFETMSELMKKRDAE